jgi:hypothetical protein
MAYTTTEGPLKGGGHVTLLRKTIHGRRVTDDSDFGLPRDVKQAIMSKLQQLWDRTPG